MLKFSPWLIALMVLLMVVSEISAQAGRLPLPRIPVSGGGGVSGPHAPHIPGLGMDGQDTILMLIAAIVLAIVMGYAGVALGRAAGRFCFEPKTGEFNQTPVATAMATSETLASTPCSDSTPASESVPAMDPLILSESEVAEKAHETEKLLWRLALARPILRTDESSRSVAERVPTRAAMLAGARLPSPSRSAGAEILAKHGAMLTCLWQQAEINRVDDLQIKRFEFVHVRSTGDPERKELTALITFEARVYFVSEKTSEFLHGSHAVGLYQEFWTFSRQASAWQLETIERSHKSDRLKAENQVEETPFASDSK